MCWYHRTYQHHEKAANTSGNSYMIFVQTQEIAYLTKGNTREYNITSYKLSPFDFTTDINTMDDTTSDTDNYISCNLRDFSRKKLV